MPRLIDRYFDAHAQGESGALVIVSGTIGFQTDDETYHSPFLDKHLAGFGWGGTLTALGRSGEVIAGGEISSVRLSRELAGRLVGLETPAHTPIPTQVNFQETFVSGLIGGTNDTHTFQLLGGAGMTLGSPKSEGAARVDGPARHWLVLTGGADWLKSSLSNTKFVFGLRYSFIAKGDALASRGVENHVLRANVGIGFGSK